MKFFFLTLSLLALSAGALPAQGRFRLAQLGDVTLENGQVLRNCRVGYRTFGKLNRDKSNAVLFLTWFAGTSQELAGQMGNAGATLDTSRFFVVALDALGNGISSSPSNSLAQPGTACPEISIRDMVATQYAVVTRELGIRQVEAIMGVSMGGMQTFQWLVSYPGFTRKAIPIIGSPRLTSQDLLLWRAELEAIRTGMGSAEGERQAMKAVSALHTMALYTPGFRVRTTPPEETERLLREQEKGISDKNALDWAWQLKAMMRHDIYRVKDQTPEAVISGIRTRGAQLLIIIAQQDQMVNPEPARTLAQQLDARLLELTGDCGHMANGCESAAVLEALHTMFSKQ